MPYTQIDDALRQCRLAIEQTLNWGDAASWTGQDFEALSERMAAQTGRVISATTLKRIWGKVAYHSAPSRHSLDTLAAFLGHPSWRSYLASLQTTASAPPHPASTADGVSSTQRARRWMRSLAYVIGAVVVLSGALAFWTGLSESPAPVPAGVYFTSRPVTQGIPNTVVFEYDVRGVQADSFAIQQSWDARRRARIAPEATTFTSTYYRPGYFNAKLIADTLVLREHGVHVTTDGWLALIEDDPVPIYLTDDIERVDGRLTVPTRVLRERGYLQDEGRISVGFYNVRFFGEARTDAFTFDAVIRNDLRDGRFPCRRAQITVAGETGAIRALVGQPGCAGELHVMANQAFFDGRTTDLSPLGIDLGRWQPIHLAVRADSLTVQAGDNEPFVTEIPQGSGRVVGLIVQFEGTGSIDAVRLADGAGAVVYEEQF